ncbi:MAG: M16 family metallopeptidase [Acidimicrobiia bacterium]
MEVIASPSRSAALAASLLLAVASCTSETTVTPSTAHTSTSGSAPGTTSSTTDPALELALPIDPLVRVGQLDNGLTYYLRHNDSPGSRAELRLLVNAGSAQETDAQSGVAHFLEHMMFNGTEGFPRNELIAALEAFGPRFGPDINAHTNFDETVYELSLDTSKEDLVKLGLEVLRDWAGRATLTEEDVVAERGVVLDEWRLRSQGFGGRIAEAYADLILPGSPYEERIPIGDPEAISTTTPDELRRFYEDWYRPELMALVAVGDFELDEMEASIVDVFSDIPSASAPERETFSYDPPDRPRANRLLDEEAAVVNFAMLWPMPARTMDTVGDLQRAVALGMALDILATRLNDDALQGESPLLGASSVEVGYARAIELFGVDVDSRPEEGEAALRAVFEEVERVKRYGISASEFERALSRFAAHSEQTHQRQESIQDVEIAAQISSHHLAGGHLMTPDQRFKVESDIIARLDRVDLESIISAVVEGPPLVLMIGPGEHNETIPEADRILGMLTEVGSATIERRPEESPAMETLMTEPEPKPPIDTRTNPDFGYTILEFGNGATVFLWQSQISDDSIYMEAESFGGTSRVAVPDLPEAFLATDIISRSGVGPANATTLERYLSNRLVSVLPWLSETREGLTGGSASKDVETLFQLTNLTMTAPRFDDHAVAAVLDEVAALNASRGDIPDILFDEALIAAYYGDDPRYFALPTPDQMADFDPEVAERVYAERFGDAGDFAFAFVGDFDISEMTDLASRYIGTLPSAGGDGGFVDNQPLPPRRVQVSTVEAGSGEQGRLGMFFTNQFQPELEDRLTARVLQLIMDTRLRERIREHLSATYSISSSIDLQLEPDAFSESFVSSTGHPDDLQRISEEVMADLAELQGNGPTPAQFATAVEQLRSEIDLIDNPTLANALITSHLYPERPVVELSRRYDVVEEITAEDVRQLARVVFDPDQRIEIKLVPRS